MWDWVTNFFDAILGFFGQVVDILFNVCIWVLKAAFWIVKTYIYFTFDGIFSVIKAVINGIDLTPIMPYIQSHWGMMPAQLIWLINAIGLPQGFSILGAAYVIRLGMNLIPSVAGTGLDKL